MPASTPPGDWRSTAFGGHRPLVGFLVGFSSLVLASNLLWSALFDVPIDLGAAPPVLYLSWGAVSAIAQIGLAAAVLRVEGVTLREVGLSRRYLAPGVAACLAAAVALNVAVAALAATGDGALAVGFFAHYQPVFPDFSSLALAASGVHAYLFVGLAEELAFRGYLQNKLVSVFGDPTPGRRAAAVVLAAASFGLLHLPVALVGSDASVGGVAFAVLVSTVSGVAFGVVYELTGNLWLVAILHGFGDWWPLFVDAAGVDWPQWGVILLVYAVVVVAYRRWMRKAPRASLGATASD